MNPISIKPVLAQVTSTTIEYSDDLPIKLFFGYLLSFVIIISIVGFCLFISKKMKEKFHNKFK